MLATYFIRKNFLKTKFLWCDFGKKMDYWIPKISRSSKVRCCFSTLRALFWIPHLNLYLFFMSFREKPS